MDGREFELIEFGEVLIELVVDDFGIVWVLWAPTEPAKASAAKATNETAKLIFFIIKTPSESGSPATLEKS